MTEQLIEWRRAVPAGHHISAFDFCEESLPFAVELDSNMLLRLV